MAKQKPVLHFKFDAETTLDNLHQQYRQLSLSMHPDVGGTNEDFKLLKIQYAKAQKYLPEILEFIELTTHTKGLLSHLIKFVGNLFVTQESFRLIVSMAVGYMTDKINSYDAKNLLPMFIAYLFSQP